MAITEDLKKIGLNSKESQAYLALLELGSASIVALAKKSSLKRTTVYEVLESLKEKGLISETLFGRRIKYIAEPPEKLLEIKKRELETLQNIMPTLDALRNVAIEKPAIRFYQGKEEIREVFRDMVLHTSIKEKILGIESKAKTVIKQFDEQFWIDLMAKKKKRGLESLSIDAYSPEELNEFVKQYPWSVNHGMTIRTIDDAQDLLNVSIYLYQNKVALIASDQLLAIVIENQRLRNSFEFLFRKLWGVSKDWKNPTF